MSNFPSGTVSFLFTDIEGSTRRARQHPGAWEAARAGRLKSSLLLLYSHLNDRRIHALVGSYHLQLHSI